MQLFWLWMCFQVTYIVLQRSPWLSSLNTILWSICIAFYIFSLWLPHAVWFSVIYLYRILFIQSTNDEHLGCLQLPDITNKLHATNSSLHESMWGLPLECIHRTEIHRWLGRHLPQVTRELFQMVSPVWTHTWKEGELPAACFLAFAAC